MAAPSRWQAPSATTPVHATVVVPGSKSLTNRYLVTAAAADSASVVRNPLVSRDSTLMIEAVRSLGAVVDTRENGDLAITPIPFPTDGAPAAAATGEDAPADSDRTALTVDCGLAGTVMRFVPPLAAATRRPVQFDGDETAYTRPMSTILDALTSLGVDVDSADGYLPFRVDAPQGVRGGHVRIDASASSQFVSGLLLSGCLYDLGVEVTHTGDALPSRPHIDMTVEVLADAGVVVEEPEPGRWVVQPGRPRGLDVVVEPDLSNAAPFLAAALVTGGAVTVPHWPAHTTQGGDEFRRIAEAFGGSVEWTREGLTVTGPQELSAVDLDLSDVGELTPVTAAVAAFANGTSTLRGIGHLRGHETDRLAALTTELTQAGAVVEEGADSLTIRSAPHSPTVWGTYHDHRMVMAGAIIGLRIPGVVLDDPDTVAKTMPTFVDLWTEAVGA